MNVIFGKFENKNFSFETRYSENLEKMGIELQVPIYIVAGVLSGVCTMLIFIMAGICGQISKLKRQQRELQLASSITNARYIFAFFSLFPFYLALKQVKLNLLQWLR